MYSSCSSLQINTKKFVQFTRKNNKKTENISVILWGQCYDDSTMGRDTGKTNQL